MDQNLNNGPNDFLWSLLENPANDANSHVYNLHRLVNDFPQSGILQALLAHASEEKNLKRASAYFSPRALFKLINTPTAFTGVPNERIVIQPGISINGGYRQQQAVFGEQHNAWSSEDLVIDKAAPPVEAVEETTNHHEPDELVIDHGAEEYISHTATEEEHNTPITPDEEHVSETAHHTENETALVHEEIANEIEPHVAEPITEEVPQETPGHGHLTDTEAHAPAQAEEPETARDGSEEKSEDVSAEIAPVVPHEHAEMPVEDFRHEEQHHQLTHEVDEHEGGYAPTEITETELPEQTVEQENGEDEPAPVIGENREQQVETHTEIPAHGEGSGESAEEIHFEEKNHPATVAEMPVEEEIAPAHEITVEREAMPEPEMPVHDEAIPEPEIAVSDDSDEVYDEIVGIEDIHLDQQPARQFFSFDQEFGAHEDAGARGNDTTPVAAEASAPGEAEQLDVSRYHDEKMPYTFMWWLDKTRKEHAQIYQPYTKPPSASAKTSKKVTDELQQQYFENIFHITSVEELDKSVQPPPVAPNLKGKEHVIIDRFIKEEPQIKPQSSDKLDNENKAKKSSEDRDELVSETLASIYSDQMLYHKAIASYKKLMLKFPEKSRYFAGKIEQLEKKTN